MMFVLLVAIMKWDMENYANERNKGMKYIFNYENGVFKSIEIGQENWPENCPDICMILRELIKMIYE